MCHCRMIFRLFGVQVVNSFHCAIWTDLVYLQEVEEEAGQDLPFCKAPAPHFFFFPDLGKRISQVAVNTMVGMGRELFV